MKDLQEIAGWIWAVIGCMMLIPATMRQSVLIEAVDVSIESSEPKEAAAKKASSKQGKSTPQVQRTIEPEEGVLDEQEQGACDGHFFCLGNLHLPHRNG